MFGVFLSCHLNVSNDGECWIWDGIDDQYLIPHTIKSFSANIVLVKRGHTSKT